MKDFMLIFRLTDLGDAKPTPEQIQERLSWLAGIAAQNKLVDQGNSLSTSVDSARTVRTGGQVTDGPYTEIKEFIAGYVIVRAETIEEAVTMAKENPIVKLNGNIEIRELVKHR